MAGFTSARYLGRGVDGGGTATATATENGGGPLCAKVRYALFAAYVRTSHRTLLIEPLLSLQPRWDRKAAQAVTSQSAKSPQRT